MNAAETLNYYRALEGDSPASAYLLVADAEARRIVAAWSTFPSRWTGPAGEAPADPARRWEWLWRGCRVSFAALAVRSGVLPSVVPGKFALVKANRLIYPNGTVNEWADRILQAEVARFTGGPGEGPDPTPDPPLHAGDIQSDPPSGDTEP